MKPMESLPMTKDELFTLITLVFKYINEPREEEELKQAREILHKLQTLYQGELSKG